MFYPMELTLDNVCQNKLNTHNNNRNPFISNSSAFSCVAIKFLPAAG